MDEFDEHYLYQTALYNSLTDTTYADTGVLKSDIEEAERTNHMRGETSRQEAYKELEEAEKTEHFSESWTMRMLNRMSVAILYTKIGMLMLCLVNI